MKRFLTLLITAVIATSSMSIAASAAETDITDTAAQTAVAESGATADEVAPTGWSLLTEAQFQSKMSSLRLKYPHGSIWEGYYYESGSIKATTCWAYSAQMLREFFGVNFYADGMLNYKLYDVDGICAGDWVRIDWDSHSIFITKVTGDGVYFTDGNGTGVYNQVRWDGFYSWSEIRSRFSYRLHLPGNNLKGCEVTMHTVDFNAGGGKGSMDAMSVGTGYSFKLPECGYTRSGYTFAGYIAKRAYDNTWYTTDAGWKSQAEIQNKGYHYKIYPAGNTYTLGKPWLGSITDSTAFTFQAQWLPNTTTVEYAANYSGYNYLLGSDLGANYSTYINSRDSSVYTVSVDNSERLNNAASLKIVGATAGKSGSDLMFNTSTNKGYGNGYSQAGIVGDDKNLVLHFFAKSSVEGAKMYLRWGYSSEYTTVTLSKGWKAYSIDMPKNRFFSTAIHPYFDTAGTYYLNSLALGDADHTTNVVPESGEWVTTQKIDRGTTLDNMPTPTREGYVFLGWYTAAEGGTRITDETPITESTIRLYAHWRKNISYTPVKTVRWNGHIYELYDNSLGWDDASRYCVSRGGHLITIDSAEENRIAYDMISDRQGYCWIGLRYNPNSSKWEWTDGSALTGYSNWFDSAFSKVDTGSYYAMMYPMNYGTTAYASTWDKCTGTNDYSTYYGYFNSFYICEYDDPVFRGDTDGNGVVELIDATMIQRMSAKVDTDLSDTTALRGDIDGNNTLDIIDTTYIQRYLAGMDTPYDIDAWVK